MKKIIIELSKQSKIIFMNIINNLGFILQLFCKITLSIVGIVHAILVFTMICIIVILLPIIIPISWVFDKINEHK